MTLTIEAIQAARERLRGDIRMTPLERSAVLSAQVGAELYLKFENQQFTASFKERGALNKLLLLGDAERRKGVAAMSAGNHAQALAYHGRRLGAPVTIVMPRHTPHIKVQQTRVFGAEVILHGARFDETLRFTQRLAKERGLTLVHPFDDEAIIAGQGTLALEMLEQLPDMNTLVVPVGGGGLIAGMALAAKAVRPRIVIVGVQAQRYSAAADLFRNLPPTSSAASTIAEGMAVESPGDKTMPIVRSLVDHMVTVAEGDIERGIFALLEVEKTVVEGAGAAGLGALLADPALADGNTALVLSGGNIDMMILSSVVQRGLVRRKRLVRVSVELVDVPGALGALVALLAEHDCNIIDIVHHRAFRASSARATSVEIVLQTRGGDHVDEVLAALREASYDVAVLD